MLDIIDRIKQLKSKWAGHFTKGQGNSWSTYTLQWYFRVLKRPGRRFQVKWGTKSENCPL